jgi:hypothetical protein
MTRVLVAILIFTIASVAQVPVPTLPRAYIDTSYHPPVGGLTWSAHTSADFKNSLGSANPGDTIVLDAGKVYEGNFTLPAKSNPNNKWIYIVGSALSSLPAPGTRVNPAASAAKMPKIVSTNVTAPLTFSPGSNHYRLIGLEVYGASTYGCKPTATPPANCFGYALIGDQSAIGKTPPDSITIDRCYVHGQPNIDQQRAIGVNASNLAVIDSYVSEIHMPGTDTQAIGLWFSPGPIKIVNNYLEAAGENVMLGGAGGLNNPWVAADVEIRNNYLFKPLSWAKVGVSIPPNNTMVVKNLLELKSTRRALIDGNTLENSWVSGQQGYGVVFTPRTNAIGGSGLLAVVDDITFTNNIIKNVASGFDMLAHDGPPNCLPTNGCTSVGEAKRILIYNNLIQLGDTTQVGYTKSGAFGLLVLPDNSDIVFQHNTVLPPPNLGYCKASVYVEAGRPKTPPAPVTHNVWILDNVLCRQINGPRGFIGQFPTVLAEYMGDPAPAEPRLLGNVFYVPTGDKAYPVPPRNSSTDVRPTIAKDGEHHPHRQAKIDTSDSQVAGVDIAKLAAAYSAESGINLSTHPEKSIETPKTKQ